MPNQWTILNLDVTGYFLTRVSKINKDHPKGCWEWDSHRSKSIKGYGQLNWDNTRYIAHRFSYEHYIGPIPSGLVIRHKCDNKNCVNPEHLEVGTQLDNMRDKHERGRAIYLKGSEQTGSKLDEEKVRFIKNNPQITGRELSKKFGIGTSVISSIRNGKAWTHVGKET